ncbi:MAG: ABC transporter ATP-binding protein/permease [Slackia sp.]|nr:ABC transporter ATP-binding protein/permease [Slackia sp.]
MLELRNITKDYVSGDAPVHALKGISLQFRDSEFVAILGQSGCGKTTMLNIVGGLDRYTSGDLVIDGVSTKEYQDRDWDSYRNHSVGFVFQSYNLIPHQDVLSNVELALTLSGVSKAQRRSRAVAALEQVGLGDQLHKKPSQMSGGQMQRVAIARALVNDPSIVLADEPTGALDSETSVQVMEILKNVAKDRLVIMVTHNPELAADYADRIVRFKDGVVFNDSDPYDPTPAEREAARLQAGEARRTSMSPLTAFSLSMNNLMTKKGRTILTAFAGSIGIIGIALILSLSSGVNDYIAKVEQDTLSTSPLTIAKQSYDMSSMLTGDSSNSEGQGGASSAADGSEGGEAADRHEGEITEFTMLRDMFASVKANDMESLKAFLDEGGDGISEDVSAIQYDYGITPWVYAADTSAGAVQLSPNAMSTAMAGGMSSSATAGMGMTGMTVFNEMIDNRDLLEEQYNVVAGRWADAPDECVLVLSSSGKVSDYTLYGIGVLDPAELDSMVDTMMNTGGEIEVSDADVEFTYEDALETSFKVIGPFDSYRKNGETGGWTNMADNADFMKQQVESGLDLHIVGVVQPDPSAKAAALSQGIAYTSGLTRELLDRAASSEIVQQQLSAPDVDVFTGKTFDSLKEEAEQGVDLSNLFTVDEAALQGAFSIDASKMGALDMSGFDFAGMDMGAMNFDLSGVGDSIDVSSLIASAPAPDFSGALEGLENDPPLSSEEISQVGELSGKLVGDFATQWLPAHGGGIAPSDPDFGRKLLEQFQAYIASTDPQGGALTLAQIVSIAGEPLGERVQQIAQDYVTGQLAPYMQNAFAGLFDQVAAEVGRAVSSQLQGALTNSMGQMAAQLGPQMASSLQNAFSFDASAFANAIHFNMDAEDLTSLMTNYANASKLTYETNLTALGYADPDDPQSIRLYPKDFEAKERVLASIDGYNERMKTQGEEDKAVVYTDYMGVLMSGVTDIVDMISLVLIAFVSISLVVSSIMIGIITYISVLERTKEIGILRAIGASKKDVSHVFNAETFIIGLAAGVLGVTVTALLNIPINVVIEQVSGVQNMAAVPPAAALILVVISVLLTLVGGIIPSRMASKKDPVAALRAE